MRSKKTIYNTISSLLLQFIIIIYGFVVPKIIISNYGSNINGLVSSISQFLAYIALLDSGFTVVIKSQLYKPIAENNKKEIGSILKASEKFFKRIAYIFIVYILIIIVAFPLTVGKNFDWIFTVVLIIIISISTFFEYYFGMVYKIFLQSDQKNYVISIINIIIYILTIIVSFIMSKMNISIITFKIVTSAIFIIRPIFQNVYVKKKYNIDIKNVKDDYKIKNKWDGLAQHIAAVIHDNTDITILSFFSNLLEVSVYSVYALVTKGIRKIIFGFTDGIESAFGNMLAKNEHKNLNEKFSIYEDIYFTILTIVFFCSITLIVPFVSVYTKGINDANYIRNTFGVLMVVSELLFAIRMPYSTLTKAAGHFKETMLGAWIECISNLVVSIVLVFYIGIVGVAIGTIVAMAIRTIEFVIHANKYILKRNLYDSLKKIILIALEIIVGIVVVKIIPSIEYNTYIDWIKSAFIFLLIIVTIVLPINLITYNNSFKYIKKIIFKFRKVKNNAN